MHPRWEKDGPPLALLGRAGGFDFGPPFADREAVITWSVSPPYVEVESVTS